MSLAAELNIARALDRGAARLAAAGVETPRLDAEVLLRHLLGVDRTRLFLHLPEPLGSAQVAAFAAMLERRVAGEPVAYLTGEREFMGLPFVVSPDVLIPRPETEILVEWALGWLAGRPAATVLDVGTGSGAIAIALAALLPPAWRGRIVAADRSVAALAVARRNRDRLAPPGRVGLVRGHLTAWCAGPVDLLLANLPYLRPEQLAANPALAAEPRAALLGGPDGLDLIRALIADAPRLLSPGGALGLEIDPDQAPAVAALLRRALPTRHVGILPDLAGRPRHAIAE